MLSISIEFLTGRYVATNLLQYEKPEWPPHPGRLFMAMASAYFAGSKKQDERDALQWLEGCGPPDIYFNQDKISQRETVTTYVPINDELGSKKSVTLTTIEFSLGRERQPRTFPTTITNYEPVYFVWTDCVPKQYLEALKTICFKIHRLGHSSSFVSVKISDSQINMEPTMVPDKLGTELIRCASKGILTSLESIFKTNSETEDKKDYFIQKSRFNALSLQQSKYAYKKQEQTQPKRQGQFSDMIILSIVDKQKPSMLRTKEIMHSLRERIQNSETSEYISGLDKNNKPSTKPHIAMAPLSFVGNSYASGTILGIAIVFPLQRDPKSDDALLNALYNDEKDSNVKITVEGYGKIEMSKDIRYEIKTLGSNTWTRPSKKWATTTPIVLDRVPHTKSKEAWWDKVGEIIATSCIYQNLPKPTVYTSNVSFQKGAPNANDFPRHCEHRMNVHAFLEFEEEITGPLLIGAGRYNGYGLCKPWTVGR